MYEKLLNEAVSAMKRKNPVCYYSSIAYGIFLPNDVEKYQIHVCIVFV
jgi:hypothetical protein